jgi:hypothetical protein
MVVGVLLIVAGFVGILVSGLDPIYSGLGLLLAAVGAGAIWKFNQGTEKLIDPSVPTTGRSHQKPVSSNSEKPKLDRRL